MYPEDSLGRLLMSAGSQAIRLVTNAFRRGRLKFVLIMFVWILLVISLLGVYDVVYRPPVDVWGKQIKLDHAQSNSIRQIKPEVGMESNGRSLDKTKVLLMTYMRGGSSFLGEMFNQNPQAVYWFEPFDGVFSDLYGSRHGWFPIDLLYDDNQRLRLFTDYEEHALNDLLTNLFTCNISALPTDTIAHYATVHLIQKQLKPYADCLIRINEGKDAATVRRYGQEGKIVPPWMCKKKVNKYSPRKFSTADRRLVSTMYCLHVHPTGPFRNMNVTLYHDGQEFVPNCEHDSSVYQDYARCMRNYRKAISPCESVLRQTCLQSRLIGIKAIRLRADLVQNMMVRNPDLRLVYEIRDPRGIVLSRKNTGLLSEASGKNITREASLLCQRVAYDLTIIRNIKLQFPDRVLQLRYEDLVQDPAQYARVFYDFLDLDVPEPVTEYLTKSVLSDVQGDAYSTYRKNGTDIALKWRTQLSSGDIKSITNVCLDVLEQFKYPTLDNIYKNKKP